MDEPTPWEDINPAIAQQSERRVTCSGLEPATKQQFAVELTACLELVAPVGMTEESRRNWLRVAWDTLGDLPPDVLAASCRKARETCDHPSKIVPAILQASEQSMRWRKDAARETAGVMRALPRPDYCTAAQAAEILKEFGLK